MAPVHFGDLASPASPGVRLREGSGPVRLCCGSSPPGLRNDFYPTASTTIDQANGGTYVNAAPFWGGPGPSFAAGLGGLTYLTGGALFTPMIPLGLPALGFSIYSLIARITAADPITMASAVQEVSGGVAGTDIIGVGVDASDRVLGSVSGDLGGLGTSLPAPTVPEGGAALKSVISIHYLPSSPTDGTVEVRLDGVASSFGPTTIGTLADLSHFVVGGRVVNPSFLADPWLQQLYRGQLYSTGVYDATVKDALLALLP